MLSVFKAVGNIRIAYNRACDKLGKHGYIRRKVYKAALCRSIAPIHVHSIAEYLEGIKANTYGQGYFKQGQRKPRHRVEIGDKEIRILAIAKHPKAQHNRGGQV